MPRLPTQNLPAPLGYDSTSDPQVLSPARAILVRNFLADRAGVLRASLGVNILRAFADGCDGMFLYQGAEPEDNRLLVVSGGVLYKGVPQTPLSDPPVWDFISVGSGFETGAQVRGVMFGTEFFFVQEGGITPLRFDGTNLCTLGTPTPDPPTVTAAPPFGGVADNKSGIVRYRARFYDSQSREGEASSAVSVNYGSYVGYDGYVTLFPTWDTIDPQVSGAYIEATAAGGSTYYKIATLTRESGQVTYEDNLTDAQVQARTLAAGTGRYSNPNAASCIAAHKGYLFLNDTTTSNTLQVSRLYGPTQFSTVTEVAASDGARLQIPGARTGNPIRQVAQFGSLLGVWMEQGFVMLWGDTSESWKPRELHVRGTVAPGSAIRTDNELLFLLDESVYKMDYTGQFINNKISQEIDADLRQHSAEERQAATAQFIQNRYCLSVGDTLYIYDMTPSPPGWVQFKRSL